MKNIYFKDTNCHFRSGENVTIRMGDKWHLSLTPGDIVNVIDYETESVSRTVKIIGTKYVPFENIEPCLLEYETSIFSTKDEILNEMKLTYNNFDSKDFVSVVTFSV